MKSLLKNKSSMLIVVAALGYFVDIYDLILFGIVRSPSLKDLGYSGQDFLDKGVLLLNMQMFGMLIGGILWGVMGDLRGRLSVLFGSIFLYSAANIANGFVQDVTWYAIIRFIAGVGLAGELGAGITLVSETMHKDKRGYGTMIIVVFGVLGAVLAAFVGDYFSWRIAYFVGGGLGLALLALRVGTYESGMFVSIKETGVKRGNFFSLFRKAHLFKRYIACITVGLPVWFTVGVLVLFSPEFAKAMNVKEPVVAGTAIMYTYLGLSFGDLVSGLLSQLLRSRKKVVILFISINTILTLIYLCSENISLSYFYVLCFLLGTATGYWALFVTIASEQFGTNIRSTVTTTVPNFVRGAVVPITLSFQFLQHSLGIINAGLIVGLVCMILAILATASLSESFGKDLNYIES